jgi:hypothetical protein
MLTAACYQDASWRRVMNHTMMYDFHPFGRCDSRSQILEDSVALTLMFLTAQQARPGHHERLAGL